ncbi:MAG: SDR family NAD(P)-dependent oxidoreductase, partial [Planctomycetes bacterium]|nr:SDR family NAD(P)-dependent oxidoreductase [Planctomycetota bacterium]
LILHWIEKGKLKKFAKLWVNGANVNWKILYPDTTPIRISLPTYPFSKERYRISETQGNLFASRAGTSDSVIHPLLHENTSDLSEQRFTSTFTGKEFFINDHQIKGEQVLPGVCYLEMARAAVEKASGEIEEGTTIHLKNIVWSQPIVVDGSFQKVHIGLYGEDRGQIQYEVYTESDNEEELIVHSQGAAEVKTKKETPPLDIQELKTHMNEGVFNAEDCYQAFKEMGMDYGEGHRGIREIFLGENQVLAKLSLPSSVQDTQSDYVLHPSLMDAALQSSIGLMLNNGVLPDGSEVQPCIGRCLRGTNKSPRGTNKTTLRPSMPFALESLEILAPCASEMYAWLRYSGECAATDKVKKLDIDLCDEQGNVCIKISGVSLGFVQEGNGLRKQQRTSTLLTKEWKPSPLSISQDNSFIAIILHNEATKALAEAISKRCKESLLLNDHEIKTEQFSHYSGSCNAWIDLTGIGSNLSASNDWITKLQEVIEERRSESIRLIYLTRGLEAYKNKIASIEGAERVGLYRVLGSEYPALHSCHVDLDPATHDMKRQADVIFKELSSQSKEVEICYRKGERYTSFLKETRLKSSHSHSISSLGTQVVLVTGGTRGLGLLCSRHLVTRYGIKRLVLTGRENVPPKEEWTRIEEFSTSIQVKIENIQALESLGAEILVMSFPLDNQEELQKQYQAIKASMGAVTGIIHAAGAGDLDNPAFVRKTPESISKILSPKVEGLQNLMQLVDPKELKFVLLFSSVSSIIPYLGVGQSDYAMANAFMDYYASAHYREFPIVSIQWPSWKETGMGGVGSQAYVNSGLLRITDAEGLKFLDQILANLGNPVVMPVIADPAKFNPEILLQAKIERTEQKTGSVRKSPVRKETTIRHSAASNAENPVQDWLQCLFKSELKLKYGHLDVQTCFAEYGVDSIFLAQIHRKINKELELELEPSILLEHSTIQDLSSWLQMTHPGAISKQFSLEPSLQDSKEGTVHEPKIIEPIKTRSIHLSRRTRATKEEIAVVGMACRFPGAPTLHEYWDLLSRGKSAIAPVAQDCWGMQTDYYAALVDEIYGIDPHFFMIPPEDVRAMDPQALVLLEESLKAIYHAGYNHQELGGKNIGVYIGARSQGPVDISNLKKTHNPIMTVGQNYLAANLSQFYDLKGPSLVIDTACSSALVGMNMAVEAMQAGVVDSALVGGVSLLTSPVAHKMFARRNLLKKNGEFHILDRRASGVVLGEGCGMVYLKPLSQAKRDGDSVYALIAGISINNDGRTAGPATPNMEAQKSVMHAALKQSGCSNRELSYLDVNGSGSEVTDLLEMKAIASVYSPNGNTPQYLGSMKPNIGHPLCAEGIASFVKVALMLDYQRLVPFLSGQEPLQHYSIEESDFAFPRKEEAMKMKYAALNCFADGGTNAHVILEEYSSSIYVIKHSPLPLPEMNRVDARTLQPFEEERHKPEHSKERILAHSFETSKVWSSKLTIDHPILANHKAYGQELLPGLAWIDLLYQWFEEAGHSLETLELRNLSIYRPLIVSKNVSAHLKIEAKETEEGVWRVQVSEGSHTTEEQDSLYITGEMHPVNPVTFKESVNIEETLSAGDSETNLQQVYQHYQTQELVHTGMMKAEGNVYTISDATWIHIIINQKCQESTKNYKFHPTLIDGSGVGLGELLSTLVHGEKRLYLPLFYESFRASQSFGSECYTRILHTSVEAKEELVSITMEFFTPEGKKIGELKEFKNKLVRNPGLINPSRKEDQDAADGREGMNKSGKSETANLSFDSMDSFLQSVIAAKLGVDGDKVAMDIGYYELGLDSAMLLKVVQTIESVLSTTLSPTLLFEYTTIVSLSNHLSKSYDILGALDPVKVLDEPKILNQSRYFKRRIASAAKTTHAPLVSSSATFSTNPSTLDIAVIGMSGRYPQAANLNEFWQNLKRGKDCITEIPKDRWDIDCFDGIISPSGKAMSKWGGFIDNADCFDPQFFKISPREAELMDPQERLFLEICWETMEDAGYTPSNIVAADGENERRAVGVYVGVMHNDYGFIQSDAVYEGQEIPLSINYAPIANRVSYVCNFHGPSMAIDTVCSSSLTAVHLAIESLMKGESKVAFAGGVNLSLHPNKYQTYGLMDMHSSDGHCHTFGKGGDGYVSAEGVGAVLLKPLEKALVDGDSVYAVLKGSSINHGGTASGFTVPSPVAQGTMIADCFKKTGVDPETISYIEAHGTGTSLGDPIEIQGLNRVFRDFTSKREFCALGSVKSNIGHAESAAGISGLTKTILQLYHKTLVKSLHSDVINPYLDLASSPFYVQSTTEEWKLSPKAKTQLRRAGVSSFGATGSNAHVILEEFPQEEVLVQTRVAEGVLLPLSAKNQDCLKEYAKQILFLLETNPETDPLSLAYTLQTGRVALEERLILMVKSIEEARQKLTKWIEVPKSSPNVWQGVVKSSGRTSRLFDGDEDLQEAISQWIVKGKLNKLAELWIEGYSMNWKSLYQNKTPQRLHLPTYPFERERYWVSETQRKGKIAKAGAAVPVIHPLLHENTSDLSEQRFTSTFTGKEFFLDDHKIKGEKVLPGSSYLEMVRAAVEKASGEAEAGTVIHLKNIVWAQPIVANGLTQKVHIGLYGEDNGQIQYEIYTDSGNEADLIVHSQGVAEIKKKEETPPIDIKNLQSQMNKGTLSAESCYQAFKEMGIDYGEGHRGIREIYKGENQLLAKLSLPSSIRDTQNEYVLHPSLLDSSLQSSIGLLLNNGVLAKGSEAPPGIGKWPRGTSKSPRGTNKSTLKPSLPFALESLEILASCTTEMYAWVRYSGGSAASNKVQKFDIDLSDEHGNVCVTMRGISSRVLEGSIGTSKAKNSIGTLLAIPVWKETTMLSSVTQQEYAEHLVLLCEMPEVKASELQTLILGGHCENLKSEQVQIESRFTEYAVRCFEMIREILEKKSQGKVLIQILVPNTREQSLFSGLSGLLKTAALENPKIVGQLIEINLEVTLEVIIDIVKESSLCPHDLHILYQEHKRFVASWSDVGAGAKPAQNRLPWKDHGVYLITGGMGGLGVLFAREILRETKEVKIILTGRSELSPQRQSVLEELQALGGSVEYRQVDVSALEQVKSLIESIQSKYGKLDGIIHSAGVISDNFILKKTGEEFRKVLLPKVAGTVNLDKATRDIALDFFVLFSSGAGAMGNIGQADYATANAFIDRFAAYRNRLVDSKERNGQTLSINWPLWREGGMGMDTASEAMMKQTTGMVPMQTETGIQAFYQSLNSDQSQTLVMEGNLLQMRSVLLETVRIQDVPTEERDIDLSVNSKTLEEKTEHYLKMQFSSLLKLPLYKIDAQAPFEEFGIDSIFVMKMTNQLEKTFGSLSKTLFFEYQTIAELTRYFFESYESKLASLFHQDSSTLKETNPTVFSINSSTLENKSKKRMRFVGLQTSYDRSTASRPLEIAIIGLSGRYPESVNVQEYWKNLRDGKDCITEVPGDRWNWREYFSNDHCKSGSHFSKWGGFIEGVDEFDPLFFNIPPDKAEFFDPQERLFLEHAWMAMEDAGYTRESLRIDLDNESSGQVGVYVGVMYGEYQLLGAEESLRGNRMGFAGNLASIANRVSYVFNLHGPSMTVDTMCSSSLTSIHLACQDLKQGRTNLAIAGGVNISIHPNKYLMLSAGQLISTKGHCESFGEGGDGYIPGEGVGVVLLKRLEEAIRDGDQIYGIIQGSAINHGGKTNGYTVPNPKAQRGSIERALSESGVDPRHISYIEAHGTGTKLGDPIEITALSQAFGKHKHEKGFCLIGSAKSNIGHCEGAAGIGGLTKVLLQMKYGQIVPSLHSSTLNPNIDFENTPFVVNQELRNWDCPVIDGQELPKIA